MAKPKTNQGFASSEIKTLTVFTHSLSGMYFNSEQDAKADWASCYYNNAVDLCIDTSNEFDSEEFLRLLFNDPKLREALDLIKKHRF